MDILIYFSVHSGTMTDLVQKLKKRWGGERHDDRDWRAYNRQLVRRGEIFLDLEWVESWNEELKEMNRNKVGQPFKFPNSLIDLQKIWHAKGFPYRMIKGITIKLVELSQLPAYNDYSTICRRANKRDIQLEVPVGRRLMLFADGTGFQAIEGGEYLRSKYGKKNRRWIQIIILGDPETNDIVSFEVYVNPTSEPDSARYQMEELMKNGIEIKAFGGDGGFDKIKLWKFLEKNRIQPIIKPQKNAREDTESDWRNMNVKSMKKRGYLEWATKLKYGKRWPATEGIFSAVKRIFGEQLRARSEIGLIQEAKTKIWAYMTIKKYGLA